MVGALGLIAYLALYAYLLILLVRLVNAVEHIANTTENHERQIGRLAIALEQLVSTKSGGTGLNDTPHEG